MKPRFLPSPRVIAGPNGATYRTAPVVMMVATVASQFPLAYWAMTSMAR